MLLHPRHAPQLRQLTRNTFPVESADPRFAHDWDHYLSHPELFLVLGRVDDDDRILCFVACALRAASAYVMLIGTRPDHRRRGYARDLLRELHARHANTQLHVRGDNFLARELYAGMGYSRSGPVLRRHYPDGGDALYMRRRTARR